MTSAKGPYYRLKLVYGKTNQTNKPTHRVIGYAGGALCPYDITTRYLTRLANPDCSLQPTCLRHDPSMPNLKKTIAYTTALSDLRYVMDTLGYDGQEFSEHSMKRGIATESSSLGMTDHEIQVQGGWSSIETARKYIDKNDTPSITYTQTILKKSQAKKRLYKRKK